MPFSFSRCYDLSLPALLLTVPRGGLLPLVFSKDGWGVNTCGGDLIGIPLAGLASRWVHLAVQFPNVCCA